MTFCVTAAALFLKDPFINFFSFTTGNVILSVCVNEWESPVNKRMLLIALFFDHGLFISGWKSH